MGDASAPLCAESARDRGDPIVGTALHLSRLLLIEHPGPWPFHALESEGVVDVVPALVEATRAAEGRTFLIRRTGRREPTERRAWAVVDVDAGRIRWGTWTEPSDLVATAVPTLAASSEDWTSEPAFLVCAHGRHDTCCAVRGRPVAAALAERWPDATWESSHVGGDRFAPNVVIVPDGTYYGALEEESVVDVIGDHLAGRVRAEYVRGSSALPPVAQAVAVAGLRRWGPAAPRSVIGHDCRQLDDRTWQVRLTATVPLPAVFEATVSAVAAPAAVLTCRAPRATSARRFEVSALRAVEAPSAPVG
ncbi:sucrase ferredoxin [Aeromicrobium halocynthiae]|uniref:Sucrase ferredoxin n=1 Tax=Aeromicrobium halocynthiae TaxID=560557 RepID=A0ABN2VVR1_9ACTN